MSDIAEMVPLAEPAGRPPETTALSFFVDRQPRQEEFRAAVLAGLSRSPRSVSPKLFYDEAGSALFENICETPEYYITRIELALLESRGAEIASSVGRRSCVIEYGTGSPRKITMLLDALDDPAVYIAIDISREHLLAATDAIARAHPGLRVGAVCADFLAELPALNALTVGKGRRLGFFPGSTIGNLAPPVACRLLERIRSHVGADGALLIGVDLKKDRALLHRAYNDKAGATAAFNKNFLRRMRRELAADLDESAFRHTAFYAETLSRIEMHLIAIRNTSISVGREDFSFAEGDGLHTESSYKFSIEEFRKLASAAGFNEGRSWTDKDNMFSLHLLEASNSQQRAVSS